MSPRSKSVRGRRLFRGLLEFERAFKQVQVIAACLGDPPDAFGGTVDQAIAENLARRPAWDRAAEFSLPAIRTGHKNKEVARHRRDCRFTAFRRCEDFQDRDLPTQRY